MRNAKQPDVYDWRDQLPTQAEDERLTKLIQESAEVIKAATKIQEHGWWAFRDGVWYDNRADLHSEMGDVEAIKDIMVARGDVDLDSITQHRDKTVSKMLRKMRRQHMTTHETENP